MSILEEKFIQLCQNEVDKLGKAHRSNAFQNFLSEGLPKNNLESWKYTNLVRSLPEELSIQNEVKNFEINESSFQNQIVIFNGRLCLDHSQLEDGISVNLNETENLSLDSLDALNKALSPQVINIKLDSDFSSSEPIHIRNIFYGKNSFIQARLKITCSPFSKACFIETNSFENTTDSWVNSVTSFRILESAHIEYVCEQEGNDSSIQTALLKSMVKKSAQFSSFNFNLGGKISRHTSHISLLENGAQAKVNGLYPLINELKADHFTYIGHLASHTYSEQLYKGILSGRSRGIFNGRVEVKKDAQQINSEQLNKNLLLSNKAQVNTLPTLLVSADDVKCSHGATIGQLNTEELFYLQSRAIDKKTALKMLCQGFSQDAINHIENSKVKSFVSQKMENRFNQFEKDI
ncbi:MAG: Fe-S cluster assembly protein SufD [Halobacteriovoraceae bacterium]|nr:Fe-S cluster assembly protein SufD [Halobacteriovoraceae bacterium]